MPKTLRTVLKAGVVLAPAAFLFQIVQSWVLSYQDAADLPIDLLRWLLPLLAAIGCGLAAICILILLELRSRPVHESEPDEDAETVFRRASMAFAQSLAAEKRDLALLDLRDKLGWLLHSQSANADRIELGALALKAAVREGATARRVEILIDDLGWASHMNGDDTAALKYLNRALALLDEPDGQVLGEPGFVLRCKTLRHLAIMEANRDLASSRGRIKLAHESLEQSGLTGEELSVEVGQLNHAEALAICIHYGILSGTAQIPPAAEQTRRDAEEALDLVRQAKARFETPGEWQRDRTAKALYVEECILRGLGRQSEAEDIAVQLEASVWSSTWSSNSDNINIKGAT